jgi:hypothetical protein
MVDKAKPDIRHSEPTHADFNARFEPPGQTGAYDGPWLKTDTLASLPNMSRDFQMNRDPLIAKQMRDVETGGDRSGRGSSASRNDKPKPELKPPLHMRAGVREPSVQRGWLEAQRETVMKAAVRPHPPPRTIEHSRDQAQPHRGQTPSL